MDTQKSVSVVETTGEATTSMAFTARPTGTKAAKDVQRADKVHKRAALTQAKAAEKMAEATLSKAASLEYHNMLLLFTAPMDHVTTPEARKFIRLLREEELLKLKRRRAESAVEEQREINEREVSEVAEAAREREEVANRAREDVETVKQMREARSDFNDEGRQNYEDPGDREILDLQDSDDEKFKTSRIQETSASDFNVNFDVQFWYVNVIAFNLNFDAHSWFVHVIARNVSSDVQGLGSGVSF